MTSHLVWLLLAALPATVAQVAFARAQSALPQARPAQQGSSAEATRPPQPFGAERLDELLAPFAGAPQDALGVVLDACRYPAKILEATQWARQEATRGAMTEAWPPTVRLLAERSPRTLEYLTQDITTTAALGTAYQYQPNDVWMAYRRVTERQAQPGSTGSQSAVAGPTARPVTAVEGRASAPGPQPAAQPGLPANPVPAQTPSAAPAPAVSTQVVVPSPPVSGTSAAGTALVGSLIGLGAGLLISELADNNGGGYAYRPPYAVPPPYAPYGSANALQENRLSAARQMQVSQQAYATGRREDLQGFAAAQQQQRQMATGQRQGERQQGTQTNQAARQAATQERQSARRSDIADGSTKRQAPFSGAATGSSTGPTRRSAATAEQTRPQGPSPAQRRAAPQQVALSAPQRSAARPVGRAPEWGPARGMSGGLEVARSRGPGMAAGARGGGARAGGGRAGRN